MTLVLPDGFEAAAPTPHRYQAQRILVAVISGKRPALAARPTARMLDELFAEFGAVEWVVREEQAPDYELDAYPINVIPMEFSNSYAATHWRHPLMPCEPGGFHGAFTGREWAMRTAQERGFDAVLQLDDNILEVGPISATRPAYRTVTSTSEMYRILAELSASTNAATLGFQLSSVVPKRVAPTLRPGYPYSSFMEKTGPGRLPYYGPFEDDIMHALEYGLKGGPGRTAGVIDYLTYAKESSNTGGMRGHYSSTRGLEIAKRYPKNVTLSVGRRTSSPNDDSVGVRHWLNTNGFTPIRVLDRERYTAAAADVARIARAALGAYTDIARAKFERRASDDQPILAPAGAEN